MSLIPTLALAASLSGAQVPSQSESEGEKAAREGIEKTLEEAAAQATRGDCAGALPRLQAVLSGAPEVPKALYLLGFCQAAQGQTEQALVALDKLIALKPGFPGLHLLRGQVLRVLGRASEAEAELKAQIETGNDPQVLPDVWFTLGIVYRDSGRSAEAVSAFERVVALAPDRPGAYLELADLRVKLGQLHEAEEILEKARQAGAPAATALLNVGVAHFNKKDYPRAVTVFSRVIEMGGDPQDVGAAYGLLGKCQLRQGSTAEAAASFRKSLELDPHGRFADESRKQLDALGTKKK